MDYHEAFEIRKYVINYFYNNATNNHENNVRVN